VRYSKSFFAALLVGAGTAALATAALAQSATPAAPASPAAAPAATAGGSAAKLQQIGPITDPDAQFLMQHTDMYTTGFSGLEQRGCTATDKVYGEQAIVIDGYRYGGCLARGADKNLDAVRVLISAAQSTGQYRNDAYGFDTKVATYLVLGDTSESARMEGSGTWNGENVKIRMDWDYRVPGVRLFVTHANGQQDIWVAADPREPPTGRIGHLDQPDVFGAGPKNGEDLVGWKEKSIGVYSAPTDMKPQDLVALAFLMPWNVVLEGRDAADAITATKTGRLQTLTIPVRKLNNATLTARLDADGHPTHTELTYNGHTYTGDFSNFLSDRGDYEVYAPHTISLQVDGKPLADWQIDWHQANPYEMFPIPTQVATK
jgi:hypothetical protein